MGEIGMLNSISEDDKELLMSFREYPEYASTSMITERGEEYWDEVFVTLLLVITEDIPGRSFDVHVEPDRAGITDRVREFITSYTPNDDQFVIPENPDEFVEHDQVAELCETFGLVYDYEYDIVEELPEGADGDEEVEPVEKWHITYYVAHDEEHLDHACGEKPDTLRFNGYPEDAIVIRNPYWIDFHVEEHINLDEVKPMYREISMSFYEPAPKHRSIRKAREEGRHNRDVLNTIADEWEEEQLKEEIEDIQLRTKKKWLKLAAAYAQRNNIDHKDFMIMNK